MSDSYERNLCDRFCDPESSRHCRHEMALDANGKRLLVTSGLVRAPIYQVELSLSFSLSVSV